MIIVLPGLKANCQIVRKIIFYEKFVNIVVVTPVSRAFLAEL